MSPSVGLTNLDMDSIELMSDGSSNDDKRNSRYIPSQRDRLVNMQLYDLEELKEVASEIVNGATPKQIAQQFPFQFLLYGTEIINLWETQNKRQWRPFQ